jgi:GAF domain-containing protein
MGAAPVLEGDDPLGTSLLGLSRLLTGRTAIDDTLRQIARFAVHAIPGADGAGLTMLEPGRAQTVVSSDAFVRAVDDIQYSLGEGPCLLAVHTGMTQTSGSLGGEGRWPRFGPQVGRLGVHSALSLPLLLPDRVIGAMNVYAMAKNAFDDRAIHVGELFARPAAVSVHNAQVLGESRRLAAGLEAALTHRAVIDQAIGILMGRSGLDSEAAVERLRQMSQLQHRKLAEVSANLVEEAVRSARARDRQGDLGPT